ncbi:MAG: hypothetical protein VR70_02065 [Rhodospirillaceae bacterium BRH_c57]|nr:MAG: hypothetical protein VR70_02065 [Rhodospirillaceae bacterium BRH_c57]
MMGWWSVVLAAVVLAGGPATAADAPAAFFDHVDEGPRDLRPPPPTLDAFDRAVLEVCGPWGARPDREAFAALVATEPDLVAAAGSLKALTEAWFAANGFAHIICGEPGPERLGGFHYQGRYLQAQAEGWADVSQACGIQEKDGPIHTLGVRYQVPRGGNRTQCPKGYVYGQSARALLLSATQAWVKARGRHDVCLAPVDGARKGKAVVVLRKGALRTYYGDATPNLSLPACGD